MLEEKGKRYGLFFFLQKMIFFEEPAKLRSGDPVPSLHRTLTSAKNRHVFGCGRRALSVLLVSKETYASVKRDLLTRLSFLPSGRRALSVLLSRHCCAPRYATCATVAALVYRKCTHLCEGFSKVNDHLTQFVSSTMHFRNTSVLLIIIIRINTNVSHLIP